MLPFIGTVAWGGRLPRSELTIRRGTRPHLAGLPSGLNEAGMQRRSPVPSTGASDCAC